MVNLDLYSRCSPEQATAAFAPNVRPESYCAGQFALLPEAVLAFLTLGDMESGTRFVSPSSLTWVPERTDYHPDDRFPWLPEPIRETWDYQRQQSTRTHRLFVRAPGEGGFLYVGPVHLCQYGQRKGICSAQFDLAERLPRELWTAFRGYTGWAIEVNHVRHRLAAGDFAALDGLLDALLENEFGHFRMTRHEEDSLHLHTNAQRGWLMYLSDPGDCGLYIRNPPQDTDPKEDEEFYCGCGVALGFPFRHTLFREITVWIVREFFMEGVLPAWVPWGDEEDDQGDCD